MNINSKITTKQKQHINEKWGLLDEDRITEEQFIKSISSVIKTMNRYTSNQIYKSLRTYEYWDISNMYECLTYALRKYNIDKTNLTQYDLNEIKMGNATRYDLEIKFAEYLEICINSAFCKTLRIIKKQRFYEVIDDGNKKQIKMHEISIDSSIDYIDKHKICINEEDKIIFDLDLEYFIKNILNKEEARLILILISDKYTNETIINLGHYNKSNFYRLKNSIKNKYFKYMKDVN